MPSYAVVHSTLSGMIRRIIADDDGDISIDYMPDGKTLAVICSHPDALPGYHPLAAGESAVLESDLRSTPTRWKSAVRTQLGTDPPEIMCALIDTSNVVTGIIMADPAVDSSPDDRLMIECYDPSIKIGWTYDPATGLFSTAGGLIPVGAPGNDTDQPVVVPPSVIPKP